MIRGAALSVFRGPNLHGETPVVRVDLGRDKPRAADVDALERELPGVVERTRACGAESWGHLFEHACIELQNLAGAELSCLHPGKASADPRTAAFPYEDEETGVRAAKLVLARFAWGRRPRAADFATRREEFLAVAGGRALAAQDRAVIRAADARGIPVARLTQRVLQLGHGRRSQRLDGTKTSRTPAIGNDLAANKDYSRRVLGALGLPVPRYRRVWTASAALQAAEDLGYPVVVKPNFGNLGDGVTVGARDATEVRDAYFRARAVGRSAIVEEVIPGEDFRLLVIDGVLRAAAKRVPAHVVGDGVSTVEELVQAVNRDPRRLSAQSGRWTRIELDWRSELLLAERGWDARAVPPAGETVFLRRNANTSDGGTAADVTDEVHPDNRAIAERAARALGLDVAGVDLLTPDIGRSLWDVGGRICEINTRPGVRKHLWPERGTARDVISPILELLFPDGANGRIPIVAVIDADRAAGAARHLARLLALEGYVPGLATPTEISIGACPVGASRGAGPTAGRMILLDSTVDAAVFALTPEDVARHGLGYDRCDVCALVERGGEEPVLLQRVRELAAATSRTMLAVRARGDARIAATLARELGIRKSTPRRVRPARVRKAP